MTNEKKMCNEVMNHLAKVRDVGVSLSFKISMERPCDPILMELNWMIEEIMKAAHVVARYEIGNDKPITTIS